MPFEYCAFVWIALTTAAPQMTREEAVSLATGTLAHDIGLPPDSIELRRATAVDWPDASLGCPQEGEVYVQVVTPGYLVSLQADGQVFAVHVAPGRAIVCGTALREHEGARVQEEVRKEDETEPAIPLPEAPRLRELVTRARNDLARRLSLEPEALDLIEISEVVWPDASLGCPQPGRNYPAVAREGYLIRLRYGKRIYRYHGGQGGVPFLCEHPAR